MFKFLPYIAAIVCNALLLWLPILLFGNKSFALGNSSGAVWLFMLLVSAFVACDLSTLTQSAKTRLRMETRHDRMAAHFARLTGLLILVVFWIALFEQVVLSHSQFGLLHLVGGLIMLLGVLLRGAAICTLKEHFATEVTVHSQQPLVQHGIYCWLRHPSETGLLTVVFGACLLLESLLSICLVVCILLPISLGRLWLEDRQLASAFGGQFHSYRQRVKSLIPFVF